MSNLYLQKELSDSKNCPPASEKPIHQLIHCRETTLGNDLIIRRALPHRERRMIGAWCFLDHFGPLTLNNHKSMDVPPHPHIGLQTVTWLISGHILHRDSLGHKQIISPGELNLMTAGKGIAHSEESVPDNSKLLHGVQLWIALPDKNRHDEPSFSHYASLPIHKQDGLVITLLAGSMFNKEAPTQIFSPLIGLDIQVSEDTHASVIPLEKHFEYGILVLNGSLNIEDVEVNIGSLLYLGCGRDILSLSAKKNTHCILIGGTPFEEEVLMWWNFVARSKSELTQATEDWRNHKLFGDVQGYIGNRLDIPLPPWK